MTRQYSFPEGHWDWPVKLSHHHAVRAGDMVFTGGQVDLDSQGTVRNIGDLDAQARNSMAYMQDLLTDLGVDFTDLVRLVVYYVGDAGDELRMLDLLADIIGHEVKPVVNLINLPELCYPDMLCEIEGVAMRAPDGSALSRQNYHLDDLPPLPKTFSHVVTCGGMIFTGDMTARSADGSVAHPSEIVAQTRLMMERLARALRAAGAGMQEVVKVNAFYLGDGTAEDWEISARIRADYFPDPGPAPTGIPVPSFPHEGLTTRIAATACAPRSALHPPCLARRALELDRRTALQTGCGLRSAYPCGRPGGSGYASQGAGTRRHDRPNPYCHGECGPRAGGVRRHSGRCGQSHHLLSGQCLGRSAARKPVDPIQFLHRARPSHDRHPGAQSGLQRHGDRDRGDRNAREPYGILILRHKIQLHSARL